MTHGGNPDVLGPPLRGQGPVPNGLEPGDIVLCQPCAPSLTQLVVVGAQTNVFDASSSSFTHVGIYAGSGLVVDSSPRSNVSSRSYEVVTSGSNVRVRRYKGITATMQWDICATAAALQGKYNFVRAASDSLVANVVATLPGAWKDLIDELIAQRRPFQPLDAKMPLYCSQLVEEVYRSAVGVTVLNKGQVLVPLPAAFASDQQFDEVSLGW